MYIPEISPLILAQTAYVSPPIVEANEETITNNATKKEKTKQVANQVDDALNPLIKSGTAAQDMASAGSKAASLTEIRDNVAAFNRNEIVNLSKLKTIDSNHPLSATHLFECIVTPNDQFCHDKGDLTTITQPMQNKIANNDFTYCEYFTLEKTRLSQGTYVKNGGVFIGTKALGKSDEVLCQQFAFEALFSTINRDEVKKYKESK